MVAIPTRGTLAQMLREERVAFDHVSPYVSRKYAPSSPIIYWPVPFQRKEELQQEHPVLRSLGEVRIASYFEQRRERWEYERPMVVEGVGDYLLHWLYPDFYLPAKKLIIEYNGSQGDMRSDSRYSYKDEIYAKNEVRVEVISRAAMKTGAWKLQLDRILNSTGHSSAIF